MKDFVRALPRYEAEAPSRWRFNGDPILISLLITVAVYGLTVLLSAVRPDEVAVIKQGSRIGFGLVAMLIAAQIPSAVYRQWAPVFYVITVLLLIVVLFMPAIKGSHRWIHLPGFNFQPSELAKLSVPMMVATYLHSRVLPPSLKDVLIAAGLLIMPVGLIAIEPDLGTSILIAAAGLSVLLFAGLYWRWIFTMAGLAIASLPVLWMVMKDYQRGRVLTLLDPERDPLGAGWNTMQAKAAIGSGGVFGKGLGHGTQSHLDFLPEGSTDFIVAVLAEELGLIGVLALLVLYVCIIARGLIISARAVDNFGRLLGGSITLTFFVYAFVNIAMVSGIAPIVGVPLPLVSYGGTAIMTLLGGFGVLMAVSRRM